MQYVASPIARTKIFSIICKRNGFASRKRMKTLMRERPSCVNAATTAAWPLSISQPFALIAAASVVRRNLFIFVARTVPSKWAKGARLICFYYERSEDLCIFLMIEVRFQLNWILLRSIDWCKSKKKTLKPLNCHGMMKKHLVIVRLFEVFLIFLLKKEFLIDAKFNAPHFLK